MQARAEAGMKRAEEVLSRRRRTRSISNARGCADAARRCSGCRRRAGQEAVVTFTEMLQQSLSLDIRAADPDAGCP